MKIAQITPGAAGMICGSCLHDNTLASALIRMGHDVALIPIYTPIRTDETDVSIDRVFYGAINVYLEQKSALFRHTPRLVDWVLDAPKLIGWASRRNVSIDPRDLGALTLSMLQGEEGKQRKELEKLVSWLRDEYRPDVVHLSNSMLLGMARRIRQELNVPVFVSIQGEDIFLDELTEPYGTQVRKVMQERAAEVSGIVSTSRYYAEHMAERLDVPAGEIHHVPLGISLDGYLDPDPAPHGDPFTIGYLARICPEKGLHLLVEAFRRLVERTGEQAWRLRFAGYLGQRDQAYFDGIMDQVRSWGIESMVEHLGEIDREGKLDFLRSLHVLSVPTTYRDPKGLFVLESMASGVPVVQPRHGAFPEIVEATGGGLLVEPGSAEALADAIAGLWANEPRRLELGRRGRAAVRRDFNDESMSRATVEVYRSHLRAAD